MKKLNGKHFLQFQLFYVLAKGKVVVPAILLPLQKRVPQDLSVTFSFPASSSSVSQKLETSSLTPPSLQPPGLPKPPALSAQPPVTCFCILPGCQGSSAGLHLLNPISKQTQANQSH